ncbi:helix-turn-helix domain-containing protein [Virgibacillus oceani]|uniref:Helix-turn-helix domain-containing protein n=1 Tax=Virgibacillus oceani TaxID=1479511 RepID=A0A917HJC0_9BACI|nr:helix-turn-helix domain-containing protein [Virgibacillus oceani]GGG81214.1 hypothetical protein GCM10011398_28280 [Virgibacillus oceani]
MKEKPMTVKGMAAFLGVHTDTVYKMVKQNKLPHFRIGGKILFSQATVLEWIREQENCK